MARFISFCLLANRSTLAVDFCEDEEEPRLDPCLEGGGGPWDPPKPLKKVPMKPPFCFCWDCCCLDKTLASLAAFSAACKTESEDGAAKISGGSSFVASTAFWVMNSSARLATSSASSRAESFLSSVAGAGAGAGCGCGRLGGLLGVTAADPMPTRAARVFFFLTPPRLAATPKLIPVPAGKPDGVAAPGGEVISINDGAGSAGGAEPKLLVLTVGVLDVKSNGAGVSSISTGTGSGAGAGVVAVVLIKKSNPDDAAGAGSGAAGASVAVVDIKKLKADAESAAGAGSVAGTGSGAGAGVVAVVFIKKSNPEEAAGAGSGAGAGVGSGAAGAGSGFRKENPLEAAAGAAASTGAGAGAGSSAAGAAVFMNPNPLAAGAGAGAPEDDPASALSLESFPLSSKPPNMIVKSPI
mmetsp:Transcript_1869/g.4243  ORF Transcript_1869/g.4243 Transcript_1869/m.4243 type:complete len:411 (+) Transcript_1869:2228-3460(+)